MTGAGTAARPRPRPATRWTPTPPTSPSSPPRSTCGTRSTSATPPAAARSRATSRRHGKGRVAKAVLIGAVPPIMVKSDKNPGGLPIEVFDGFRAAAGRQPRAVLPRRAQRPLLRLQPPGREGLAGRRSENWWRQGMMGGAKAHYDCIKAFSETDFTEDLKAIDVPVLVMHGDDDQIVPIADSALLSAKLLKNGTLKVYEGLPHGMCTTHPTSSTRTCWRSSGPDIALQWPSNTHTPTAAPRAAARPGRRLLRSGAGNGVMVDPALTGRHRRAQRPCTLRHLLIESEQLGPDALGNRDVQRIRGRRVRSSRCRKAAAAATSAIPVSARPAARAVQASKVANSVSPGRQGVGREQRHQHADIEVEAQRPASSRSRLSSAPASSATRVRPERRPASRDHPAILRAGYATGRSSTTGLPCRMITTTSPRSARSISSDRRFLASTTACALISKT